MVQSRIKNVVVILSFIISFNTAMAQNDDLSPSTGGPRQQLATIVFAGLAGAILGLSTLSFYGRPQDKLANIAVGFAIGIISGTIYTTYKTATNPYGLNELSIIEVDRKFSLLEEHRIQGTSESDSNPIKLAYEWSF